MMQSAPAPRPLPARNLSRSQGRVVAIASLGDSLEFYDFVTYGIFAQYIARQFFRGRSHCFPDPVLLGAGAWISRLAARRNRAQRPRRPLWPGGRCFSISLRRRPPPS